MINLILLFILWSAQTYLMMGDNSRFMMWGNGILFGFLIMKTLSVVKKYVRSL